MTKHFCDCCGQEEDQRLYPLRVFSHVLTDWRNMGSMVIHNGKIEPTSHTEQGWDLCLACYNEIASKIPVLVEKHRALMASRQQAARKRI